mmetsp:Transcript_9302/g.21855  ORF Transcript_9302/g.21855 Transcript_9302/m.21855 type:complete len:236 (-) Transcript_9302:193-900(-)
MAKLRGLASQREGPGELAAREIWRVARTFMPTGCILEDEKPAIAEEMRRVASQVLLRPNTLLQELKTGASKRRASASSKILLEEIRPSTRLRRTTSEVRLRDGLKRSASDAQLPECGLLQHSASGPGLVPKRADGALRGEDEPELTPVWQAKESDRPCLVPPLCSKTAQIEADSGFFAWANKIVQDVAEEATTANFSVAKVPGPPPLLPFRPVEAIQPPSAPPPWQSSAPVSLVR